MRPDGQIANGRSLQTRFSLSYLRWWWIYQYRHARPHDNHEDGALSERAVTQSER